MYLTAVASDVVINNKETVTIAANGFPTPFDVDSAVTWFIMAEEESTIKVTIEADWTESYLTIGTTFDTSSDNEEWYSGGYEGTVELTFHYSPIWVRFDPTSKTNLGKGFIIHAVSFINSTGKHHL